MRIGSQRRMREFGKSVIRSTRLESETAKVASQISNKSARLRPRTSKVGSLSKGHDAKCEIGCE